MVCVGRNPKDQLVPTSLPQAGTPSAIASYSCLPHQIFLGPGNIRHTDVASMIDGHTFNWDASIVFPQEFPLSLVCEYKSQLNLKVVLDWEALQALLRTGRSF